MEKSLLLSSPGHLWTRTGQFTAMDWTADGTLLAASFEGEIVALSVSGSATRVGNIDLSQNGSIRASHLDQLPDGKTVFLTSTGEIALTETQATEGNNWIYQSGIVAGTGPSKDLSVIGNGVAVALRDEQDQSIRLAYCPMPFDTACNELRFSSPDLFTGLPSTAIGFDNGDAIVMTVGNVHRIKLDSDGFVHPQNALSFRSDVLDRLVDAEIVGLGMSEDVASIAITSPEEPRLLFRTVGLRTAFHERQHEPKANLFENDAGRPNVAHANDLSGATAYTSERRLFAVQWSLDTTREGITTLFRTPGSLILDMEFSPDGQSLAVHHPEGISVFNIHGISSDELPLARMPVSDQAVPAVHVDTSGNALFSGAIRADGAALQSPSAMPFSHLTSGPQGQVAAIDSDGAAWEWPEASTVRPVALPIGYDRLAYTGNGQLVLARFDELVARPIGASGEDFILKNAGQGVFGGVTPDPNNPDAVYFSNSSGQLFHWVIPSSEATLAVPADDSIDRNAGLSLHVDPSGRWLTSTRADNQIRVYDLEGKVQPVSLAIDSNDTKVVAFSPDGRHLAALSSAGLVYVWQFETLTGVAERIFAVDPMPLPDPNGTNLRSAQWIDWLDNSRVAVSTAQGEILSLSILQDDWIEAARRKRPMPLKIDGTP